MGERGRQREGLQRYPWGEGGWVREGNRGKDYRDTPGEKGVDERGRQREGLQRYPWGEGGG